MNGSALRELRLYKQMDIPTAIGLTGSATITATEWAGIEASDAKCPAAIEKVWGLITIPGAGRVNVSTPPAA